ncbi:hypothetical protein FJZ20_02265 [Candidatus Pacearchaeota archaeon]|nr:hypothetical protein [Candidatus Pacearchaeota archaeon]
MFKKHSWVIGTIFFVFLLLIMSSFLDMEKKEADEEPEYTEPVEKEIENIEINEDNLIKTLQSDNLIHLDIEGRNNEIRIASDAHIQYAIIGGINNTLILCRGRHSPTVLKSGEIARVIYEDCYE